eukprot:287263-Chlamydomonas_euryale.AAC.1
MPTLRRPPEFLETPHSSPRVHTLRVLSSSVRNSACMPATSASRMRSRRRHSSSSAAMRCASRVRSSERKRASSDRFHTSTSYAAWNSGGGPAAAAAAAIATPPPVPGGAADDEAAPRVGCIMDTGRGGRSGDSSGIGAGPRSLSAMTTRTRPTCGRVRSLK